MFNRLIILKLGVFLLFILVVLIVVGYVRGWFDEGGILYFGSLGGNKKDDKDKETETNEIKDQDPIEDVDGDTKNGDTTQIPDEKDPKTEEKKSEDANKTGLYIALGILGLLVVLVVGLLLYKRRKRKKIKEEIKEVTSPSQMGKGLFESLIKKNEETRNAKAKNIETKKKPSEAVLAAINYLLGKKKDGDVRALMPLDRTEVADLLFEYGEKDNPKYRGEYPAYKSYLQAKAQDEIENKKGRAYDLYKHIKDKIVLFHDKHNMLEDKAFREVFLGEFIPELKTEVLKSDLTYVETSTILKMLEREGELVAEGTKDLPVIDVIIDNERKIRRITDMLAVRVGDLVPIEMTTSVSSPFQPIELMGPLSKFWWAPTTKEEKDNSYFKSSTFNDLNRLSVMLSRKAYAKYMHILKNFEGPVNRLEHELRKEGINEGVISRIKGYIKGSRLENKSVSKDLPLWHLATKELESRTKVHS